MTKLHIDIETYSSVELKTSGLYKYIESEDFEILLVAYARDQGPIRVIDLAMGEELPEEFIDDLLDPEIEKCAHNATFERVALKKYGYHVPREQWYCSMVKSAYCGLPLKLDDVSKVLNLGEKGKKSTGTALIRYFCKPCKPTKVNGGRTRNFPHHDTDKWEGFKSYVIGDVEAEREILNILSPYIIPDFEREYYFLDQDINDRGIMIDQSLAKNAVEMNAECSVNLRAEMKELTGLENPNSVPQLIKWLSNAMGKEIKSVAKDLIPALITEAGEGTVKKVLELRQKTSRTSIKKYQAMLNCVCSDGKVRGMFQFYGANRTGRWAGRIVQLQNLVKNHLKDLEGARRMLESGDFELATLMYDDISSILSQLVRTAFIAPEGMLFAVADFSSIEARVTAWLAGEQWRMDVFNTHGKIYEASASMMFKVPIEEVTKGSDYRAKGKVAELALGYGGSVGALTQMGGEEMGLTQTEMKNIVTKWRATSPAIVQLWKSTENFAKRAMKTGRPVTGRHKGLIFDYDGTYLTIQLPSGRKLFYYKPSFTKGKFGGQSIRYMGMNQITKQWTYVDTWGGKMVENIVQAFSRDVIAFAMKNIAKASYLIELHVHDESAQPVPEFNAKSDLKDICDIMSITPSWAEGLPLAAEGYLTPFYKKE